MRLTEIYQPNSIVRIGHEESFSTVEREAYTIAVTRLCKIARSLGHSPDVRNLRGLSLLSLGCGSRLTPRSLEEGGYPPAIPLLAGVHEVFSWGVDKYAADPRDAALYHHVQSDLVRLICEGRSLSDLVGGQRFNIVECNRFVGDAPAPELEIALSSYGRDIESFKDELCSQAAQILVPGGCWFMENDIFEYTGNGLEYRGKL